MKFKIGDRVRVLSDAGGIMVDFNGRESTIKDIEFDSKGRERVYLDKFSEGSAKITFWFEDLELVK